MYPWKGILNPRPFTDRLPVQLSLELFFHFVPSGCFISVWLWVRPAPSGGPQDNKRNIPIRGHTTKEQPHFARLFLAECRKSFWRLQRQRGQSRLSRDWGIVRYNVRIRPHSGKERTFCRVNPSEQASPAHLPLHFGGFGAVLVYKLLPGSLLSRQPERNSLILRGCSLLFYQLRIMWASANCLMAAMPWRKSPCVPSPITKVGA